MSKSSNTAGDGIAMSADMIKLLAPVLKNADRSQFEKLKRNSALVQEVFRRLLQGEPIVRDYGQKEILFPLLRHENKTEVEFDSEVQFFVKVEEHNGLLIVSVVATMESMKEPLWIHTFENLMSPINAGYISVIKIGKEFSFCKVQEVIIAERASLTFLDDLGTCRINFCCENYHVDEPIDWDLINKLRQKGSEVVT